MYVVQYLIFVDCGNRNRACIDEVKCLKHVPIVVISIILCWIEILMLEKNTLHLIGQVFIPPSVMCI